MASNESMYGYMSTFSPAFDTEPPPISEVDDLQPPAPDSTFTNFNTFDDFSNFTSVNNVENDNGWANFTPVSFPSSFPADDVGQITINSNISVESSQHHLNEVNSNETFDNAEFLAGKTISAINIQSNQDISHECDLSDATSGVNTVDDLLPAIENVEECFDVTFDDGLELFSSSDITVDTNVPSNKTNEKKCVELELNDKNKLELEPIHQATVVSHIGNIEDTPSVHDNEDNSTLVSAENSMPKLLDLSEVENGSNDCSTQEPRTIEGCKESDTVESFEALDGTEKNDVTKNLNDLGGSLGDNVDTNLILDTNTIILGNELIASNRHLHECEQSTNKDILNCEESTTILETLNSVLNEASGVNVESSNYVKNDDQFSNFTDFVTNDIQEHKGTNELNIQNSPDMTSTAFVESDKTISNKTLQDEQLTTSGLLDMGYSLIDTELGDDSAVLSVESNNDPINMTDIILGKDEIKGNVTTCDFGNFNDTEVVSHDAKTINNEENIDDLGNFGDFGQPPSPRSTDDSNIPGHMSATDIIKETVPTSDDFGVFNDTETVSHVTETSNTEKFDEFANFDAFQVNQIESGENVFEDGGNAFQAKHESSVEFGDFGEPPNLVGTEVSNVPDHISGIDEVKEAVTTSDDFGVFNDAEIVSHATEAIGVTEEFDEFGNFDAFQVNQTDSDEKVFEDGGSAFQSKPESSVEFDDFGQPTSLITTDDSNVPSPVSAKDVIQEAVLTSDDFGVFNDAEIISHGTEVTDITEKFDEFGNFDAFQVDPTDSGEKFFAEVGGAFQSNPESSVEFVDFGQPTNLISTDDSNVPSQMSASDVVQEAVPTSDDFGVFNDAEIVSHGTEATDITEKFDEFGNFDAFQVNQVDPSIKSLEDSAFQAKNPSLVGTEVSNVPDHISGTDKVKEAVTTSDDFGVFNDAEIVPHEAEITKTTEESDDFGNFDNAFQTKPESFVGNDDFGQFGTSNAFPGEWSMGHSVSVDETQKIEGTEEDQVLHYLDSDTSCFPCIDRDDHFEVAEKRVYDLIGHLCSYVKSDEDLSLWQELNMSDEDDSKYSISFLSSNSFKSQIISFNVDYRPEMDNMYSILIPEQAASVPKNTLLAQSLIKSVSGHLDKDVLTPKTKESTSEATSETTSLDLEFFINNAPVTIQNTDQGTTGTGNLLDINSWDSQQSTDNTKPIETVTSSNMNAINDAMSNAFYSTSTTENGKVPVPPVILNEKVQVNESACAEGDITLQEDIGDAFEWGETVSQSGDQVSDSNNITKTEYGEFGNFAFNTDNNLNTGSEDTSVTTVQSGFPSNIATTTSGGDFSTFSSNIDIRNDNMSYTSAGFKCDTTNLTNVESADGFSNFISTEDSTIDTPEQLTFPPAINILSKPPSTYSGSQCSDHFSDYASGVDTISVDTEDELKGSIHSSSIPSTTGNIAYDFPNFSANGNTTLVGDVSSLKSDSNEVPEDFFASFSTAEPGVSIMDSSEGFTGFTSDFNSTAKQHEETENTIFQANFTSISSNSSSVFVSGNDDTLNDTLVNFDSTVNNKVPELDFSNFASDEMNKDSDLASISSDTVQISAAAFTEFTTFSSVDSSSTATINSTDDFACFTSNDVPPAVPPDKDLANFSLDILSSTQKAVSSPNDNLIRNDGWSDIMSSNIEFSYESSSTKSSELLDSTFSGISSDVNTSSGNIINTMEPEAVPFDSSVFSAFNSTPAETLQPIFNESENKVGKEAGDLLYGETSDTLNESFGNFVQFENLTNTPPTDSFIASTASWRHVTASPTSLASTLPRRSITNIPSKDKYNNADLNFLDEMEKSSTTSNNSEQFEDKWSGEITSGMLALDINKDNTNLQNPPHAPVPDMFPDRNFPSKTQVTTDPVEIMSQTSIISDIAESPRFQSFKIYSQLSGTSIEVDSCSSVSDYQFHKEDFGDFTEPIGGTDEFAEFECAFTTTLSVENRESGNIMGKTSLEKLVSISNASSSSNPPSIFSSTSSQSGSNDSTAFSELQSHAPSSFQSDPFASRSYDIAKSSNSDIMSGDGFGDFTNFPSNQFPISASPSNTTNINVSSAYPIVSTHTSIPPIRGLNFSSADTITKNDIPVTIDNKDVKAESKSDLSTFADFSGFQDATNTRIDMNSEFTLPPSQVTDQQFNQSVNHPVVVTEGDVTNLRQGPLDQPTLFQSSDQPVTKPSDSQLLESLSFSSQQLYGPQQHSMIPNFNGVGIPYGAPQRFPNQSPQVSSQGFPNQTQDFSSQVFSNVYHGVRPPNIPFQNDMVRMQGFPNQVQQVMSPNISKQTDQQYGVRREQLQQQQQQHPHHHQPQQQPHHQQQHPHHQQQHPRHQQQHPQQQHPHHQQQHPHHQQQHPLQQHPHHPQQQHPHQQQQHPHHQQQHLHHQQPQHPHHQQQHPHQQQQHPHYQQQQQQHPHHQQQRQLQQHPHHPQQQQQQQQQQHPHHQQQRHPHHQQQHLHHQYQQQHPHHQQQQHPQHQQQHPQHQQQQHLPNKMPKFQSFGGKDPFASFTIRSNAEQLDISLTNRTLTSNTTKPKLNQIPTKVPLGSHMLHPTQLGSEKGDT